MTPGEGRTFIAGLPAELAAQQALLTRLLDAVEDEPRWDVLTLGCSVAAGRADALSDLDLLLAHGPQAPPMAETTALLRGLGDVVEVHDHMWDGMPRWWVLYADGTQVDLVVMPATDLPGRAPASVPLLDRNGRLASEFTPRGQRAGASQLRDWALDGGEALMNAAKYLDRGSLLEALEQVQRARTRVLQLWAAGEGVDHPAFGITSLLDAPGTALPPGIELTWTGVDVDASRAAATRLLELLRGSAAHADPTLATPLLEVVAARLR